MNPPSVPSRPGGLWRRLRRPDGSAGAALMRNGLWNAGNWVANAVLLVVVTPFLYHRLGNEAFGVYTLLVGVVGYYALLDLGLGQGVVKFVAEFRAGGAGADMKRLLTAAFWAHFLIGAGGLLALLAAAGPLLAWLKVPASLAATARAGLVFSALAFFCNTLYSFFTSVLMGAQHFRATAGIGIAASTALNLGILAVLAGGGGLLHVMILQAAAAFAGMSAAGIWARRCFPEMRFFPPQGAAMARRIVSFSGYLFIARVSALFCNSILPYVISVVLGPAAVPLYAVSWRLINALGGFLSSTFNVIFPFASSLAVTGSRQQIGRVLQRVTRLFVSLAFPLHLALILFSRQILTAWMGVEFAQRGHMVFSVLAGASLIASLTTVPNLMTMGLGHTRVLGLFSLGSLAVYLVFVPLSLRLWGISGIGYGPLVATLPGIALIAYEIRVIFGTAWSVFMRSVFAFQALPLLVSSALWPLVGRWRPDSRAALLAPVLVYLSVYMAVTLWGDGVLRDTLKKSLLGDGGHAGI